MNILRTLISVYILNLLKRGILFNYEIGAPSKVVPGPIRHLLHLNLFVQCFVCPLTKGIRKGITTTSEGTLLTLATSTNHSLTVVYRSACTFETMNVHGTAKL